MKYQGGYVLRASETTMELIRGAFRPRFLVFALVAVALLAVACSSDDGAASEAAAAANSAAAAAQQAASAAQQASAAAQDNTAAEEAMAAAQAASEAAAQAAEAAEAASMAAQDDTTASEALAAAQQAAEAAQVAAAAAEEASAAAMDDTASMAAEEAMAAAQVAVEAAEAASMAAMDDTASMAAGEAVAAAHVAAEAAAQAAEAAEAASMAAEAAATAVSMASSGMAEDPGSLVVYSGRSESLVAPIIAQFAEATGIDVQVKYGSTFEVAATLLEEGENSPADVFFAQDPGGLGAVSSLLTPMPSDIVLAVPEWARAPDGKWIGISGRARVVVYSTELVNEDELPTSVMDLTDPKWKGKMGWPPTNSSFRTMVTAMRIMWGEEETKQWLMDMQANDIGVFPKNTPIVQAAGNGEVAIGLVNHYYLHRFIQEYGDDFAARNLFLKNGGPDSLVMVAGAGILETGENRDNAEAFMRFMLSKVAQQYFAGQTFEYPLVEGVKTHRLLPPIDTLNGPDIDLSSLSDLQGTDALLRETGVIP